MASLSTIEAEAGQFAYRLPESMKPQNSQCLQAMRDVGLDELPSEILAAMATSETFLQLAAVRPPDQTNWPCDLYRVARHAIAYAWVKWFGVRIAEADLAHPEAATHLVDVIAFSNDIRVVLRELQDVVDAGFAAYERERWPDLSKTKQ